MRKSVVLITNNSILCHSTPSGRLVKGSSLDVFINARNAIHRGSRLLTHPLCGNLRPYQQPFRSILIEENPGSLVDLESLSIIEEAILVYRNCEDRLLLPEKLDELTRKDFAFVDFELMRDSLERYRVLPKNAEPVF